MDKSCSNKRKTDNSVYIKVDDSPLPNLKKRADFIQNKIDEDDIVFMQRVSDYFDKKKEIFKRLNETNTTEERQKIVDDFNQLKKDYSDVHNLFFEKKWRI